MRVTTLSTKGQLVLPKEIRERLGLSPGDRLKVELSCGRVVLEPVREKAREGWRRWRGAFAGSNMLQEHLAEHRLEVERDEEGA
jgi:AbrB family looped-hinge helix DNA binding protein